MREALNSLTLPLVPFDRAGPLTPPPSSQASPSSHPTDEDPERDVVGALHEVSNALTVVVGWLERARQVGSADPDLSRALEIASARAIDGRHIARRAIGAAPGTFSAEQPLDEILAEAIEGVLPEASARGIRLRSSNDGHGTLLDEARIALQILTNLLLNAVAFSPPSGTVRLEASCGRDDIELFVTDEGPGVVAERRSRVFQRGRSTRQGGAGVGLSHARALARRCGGELSLEPSERGARFRLRWPRAIARPVVPPPTPSTTSSLGGKRVLVVEDDGAVLVLLETALSARGAEVICVRSSSELVGALSSGVFDAALVDLSPIASDVAGHLRSLRAASPDVRLVVISGSAAPADEAMQSAAAWVRKPFDLGEIIASLSQLG